MYRIIFVCIVTLFQSCVTDNKPPLQDSLAIDWNYKYKFQGSPDPIPLVVGDSLVITSLDGQVISLFIHDGSLKWSSESLNEFSIHGKGFLLNKKNVFANHTNQLFNWNVENGERKWSIPIEDPLTLFNIGTHASTSYGYAVAAGSNQIFTVDFDGNILFRKQIEYSSGYITHYQNKLYLAQGKTVHGALTLGRITVLNAQDGDSLWAYNADNGAFNVASIVEDGIVYAGAFGNSPLNEVVALDAESGEVIWRYESDYIYTRAFALGPEHVYVNTGGSLAALNKQTGELEWRVEWLGTASTKPVYLGGYVYLTNYSELMVIDDESGQVVHREPSPDGTAIWHVAASSDKIFAQTSRQLIAYQPWHLREE
ncbi:MAG: PQQ-binding-like beta-propeller repeat protein [Gracilimonas sp.]|nr:PQQ-binding-like beta-propeller repeat protein [Gracilimonas sp.]